MEEVIKCQICQYTFNFDEKQPVIIKCGHTYCKECVIAKLNNEVECVKCGIITILRDEFYLVNYLVEEIMTILYQSNHIIKLNNSPGNYYSYIFSFKEFNKIRKKNSSR
jgi:hypothetical protein